MSPDAIAISPTTRAILIELADRTGRPTAELLDMAVAALRQSLSTVPVTSIPGVDPADVWEAAADVEAGRVHSHAEVFARLRGRP
jgi:hypothetical protein